MILKATKPFLLKTSTGNIKIKTDDIFRTNSTRIIAAGYARKLDKRETNGVLDEYAAFAEDLFNRCHRE